MSKRSLLYEVVGDEGKILKVIILKHIVRFTKYELRGEREDGRRMVIVDCDSNRLEFNETWQDLEQKSIIELN